MSPTGFPTDSKSLLAAAKYSNELGAASQEQGLHFYFHNHAHEFQKIDDRYTLDLFYESTDPQLVYAQIDVFWVQYADVDPSAYLRQYPNRCPLVHIKDMDKNKDFTEVGHGVLDWDNIFAACEEVNTQWYVVEQDTCHRPSMESAKISFETFRKRGMV